MFTPSSHCVITGCQRVISCVYQDRQWQTKSPAITDTAAVKWQLPLIPTDIKGTVM